MPLAPLPGMAQSLEREAVNEQMRDKKSPPQVWSLSCGEVVVLSRCHRGRC